MSEWQVFLVIVAIFTFITAVTTPIVKLVSSITKLTSIVDSLQKDIGSIVADNRSQHEKLSCRNDEQDKLIWAHDKTLAEHSMRIGNAENALERRSET